MSVISYVPIEWDLETPINVTNLDKMDTAISELTTATNVATGENVTTPTGTELIPMQALNGDALKINYNALAKAIVEQYTGSSLGGTEQAIKTIIDSLSTKVTALITDLIIYRTVDLTGTPTPNANFGVAIAPTVAGYTFVCWLQPSTIGFVGAAYSTSPVASTTNVWMIYTHSTAANKVVRCTALYIKDIS